MDKISRRSARKKCYRYKIEISINVKEDMCVDLVRFVLKGGGRKGTYIEVFQCVLVLTCSRTLTSLFTTLFQ